MSTSEVGSLLEVVLTSAEEISSLVTSSRVKDIEEFVNNPIEDKDILGIAKSFVEELYDKSKTLSDNFLQQCSLLNKKNDDDDANREKITEKDSENVKNYSGIDKEVNGNVEANDTLNETNSNIIESSLIESDINRSNKENEPQVSPTNGSLEGKNEIHSSGDTKNFDLDIKKESQSQSQEKEPEHPKPMIKLVDFNKLIDPSRNKLINNTVDNTSVVILSSSDDEPPKKLVNRSHRSSKSNHKKSVVEISSSEEDSRTKSKKDHKSPRQKVCNGYREVESSNSEEEYNTEKTKKGKNGDYKARKTKKRGNSRRKDDSDSEEYKTSKISRSKSKKSESLRHKKKEILEISSLSDSSDIEYSKKSNNQKKNEVNEVARLKEIASLNNDVKYNCKVYVPLPLIPADKLKETYLEKLELLDVKRLANLKSLNKAKPLSKKKKPDSEEKEDEKSKTSKKGITIKLSLNKSKTTDSSTDDEEILGSAEKNREISPEKNNGPDESFGEADQILSTIRDGSNDDNNDKETHSGSDKGNDDDDAKKKSNKDEDKHKDKEDDEMNRDENKEGTKGSDTEVDSDTESAKKRKRDKNPSSDSDKSTNDQKKKSKVANSDKNDVENESDIELKKAKEGWKNDKLLTEKLSSSDSDSEEFGKYSKRKDEKSKDEIKRKVKKRVKKKGVISDSDEASFEESDQNSDNDSESSEKSKKSDESEDEVKKPKRKRIKRVKDSSSEENEDKSTRKQIRRVIGKDSLSETTKKAEAEEKERKARILEKQKKYNAIFDSNFETNSKVDKVVLDFDEKTKEELLKVHDEIVEKLKPHQASGIRFMWDACFESLKRAKTTPGSGCILAHCMGLGKTLQVIALTHTLIMHAEETGINKVMVVSPINTVLNWKDEYRKWMPDEDDFEIYELVSCKQNNERTRAIMDWHKHGGVLIIGYTMFRNLSNPDNKRLPKKMRIDLHKGLVDPGPDMVICDEGHLLKNEKTNLSIAMNRIKTVRRIVLTGTPLQNNLKEYWCMVQFIKPNLLGTYKEYLNRFVNPITNGQYTDSTPRDIQIMRKRSHVLHKMLDGVVQRRDYAVLQPYLPPKHEYVLFVNLTEIQVKLYEHYMVHFARRKDSGNKTSFLFTDFQELQRICVHPRVLMDRSPDKLKDILDDEEEDSEGSLKDFIDDKVSSSGSSSSSDENSDKSNSKSESERPSNARRGRVTRAAAAQRREEGESEEEDVTIVAQKQWWQEFIDGDELNNINHSGKMYLLFEILRECEQIGDKVLVFSQSLYTLNCIEYFLDQIDTATQEGNTEKVGGHKGSWTKGLDYFRLDGSSSCDNRAAWCNNFNNPKNIRARLFLISTKAGGLGINLIAANRVIIFDVSWNPSHDIQSIYRVYRFGQTKPSYVYRFVTYGAMEMKIYERQVTKQAISKRVIDEQQIDRHYNQNDLQELYKCDLRPTERPIPLVPKDVLLGEMLQKHEKHIYQYHEHQSLLENKEDEVLNEEERKAAWEEFENEKLNKNRMDNTGGTLSSHSVFTALSTIVRKDNPTWNETQVKAIVPAMFQQLQLQLAEGDMTLYARVQGEVRYMQMMQAQKLKEQFYQQQVMRMIQAQQQHAGNLGNMFINPNALQSALSGAPGPSIPPRMPQRPNDVIDLND